MLEFDLKTKETSSSAIVRSLDHESSIIFGQQNAKIRASV